MLNKLPYKQKLKWLGIVILPILLVCYNLAISNTLSEYKLYKQNKILAEDLRNSANGASSLLSRQEQITEYLKSYSLDTLNEKRNLLQIVTGFCNDNQLQLREYKPLEISESGGLKLLTRVVTIEGPFLNCVQMVYALETQYKAGRISSVYYKSYRNPNDKTVRLQCTIYVQNII